MTRVALVTGGGRGIGRAAAQRLARDGCRVLLTWRSREEEARQVVDAIRREGGSADAFALDLSDPASIDRLGAAMAAEAEAPAIVVNNAGEIRDRLFVFQSDDDLRHVIDVNLVGTMRLTRHLLKAMLRRRWGRIVNIASDSALTGNAGQTNYSAAKAGLIGFTKSLAREVGSFGITVNALAPGFVETEILAGLPESKRTTATASIPLGRFGDPAEMAGPISFLASDASAYVTGAVLRVDGGLAP